MDYVVFSVFDRVAGAFSAPQIAINEATAVRSFKQQAAKSPFNADLDLYVIGTFNGESGEIIGQKPTFVTRFGSSEGVEENA